MKKMLILLLLLITISSRSQLIRNKITTANTDNHFKIQIRKNYGLSRGFVNNISTRIINDIDKRFTNVANIRWFVNEDIITCYFDYDSIHFTNVYLKNGSPVLTRKDYESNKLDTTIINFLKGEFGTAYSMDLVTELVRDNYTIYSISLQNPEYWCIVEVWKSKEEDLKINNKQFLKKV